MSNNEKNVKTMAEVISGAICGVLMMVCVITYIVLGVTLNFWHPGWIILVAGGIFCGIISLVCNTIEDVKRIRKQEAQETQEKQDKKGE